jgi:hypothetical protein
MSARSELAAINTQLTEATKARDAAQEAHDRLAKPALLLDEAKEVLVAEQKAHGADVTAWYTNGCVGPRPPLPSSLEEAERKIGELTRDKDANEPDLETAAGGLQAAIEHHEEISVRQRGALYRAAVEAARERLEQHCLPAMIRRMAELDVVQSLSTELLNRGGGANPQPEAMSASREIDQAIEIARKSIALRASDLAAAKAFLDELAINPNAVLPGPGEAVIEHIKPVILGPTPTYQISPPATVEEPQPAPDAWPNPAVDPDGAWHRMHPSPIWSSPRAE